MSYDKHDRDSKTSERKSGRAAFDSNGQTVWEWQTTTGVFERHVSDEKLHELTSPNLALVEDYVPVRKFEGLWVHDAHRPVATPFPSKAPTVQTPRPTGSVMGFLRRFSGR